MPVALVLVAVVVASVLTAPYLAPLPTSVDGVFELLEAVAVAVVGWYTLWSWRRTGWSPTTRHYGIALSSSWHRWR
jgi:hypothetical protein